MSAVLDISSIKNISGAPVTINGNVVPIGASVYAFYKESFFGNNAGDLQQALTLGQVECYDVKGNLMTLDDSFVASSRTADYLIQYQLMQSGVLSVNVSSDVALGVHESVVNVETDSALRTITLPPLSSVPVGTSLDIVNVGANQAVIQASAGESIGATGVFSVLPHTSNRFTSSGLSWGVIASQGSTGAIGVAGPTGAQGFTGVQGVTGLRGLTGIPGPTGAQGMTGTQGYTGMPGPGIPAGGLSGQLLYKKSNASYDTEWQAVNFVTVDSDQGITGIKTFYRDVNVYGLQLDAARTNNVDIAGNLHWDSDDRTAALGMGNGVIQQIGEELFAPPCRNDAGVPITNGQVVFVSGSLGQRVAVQLAAADSYYGSQATIGIATEDIATNGTGLVTTHGMVNGVDTSAWAPGTPLYLSSTPGALSSSVPPKGMRPVFVGIVIKQGAGNGSIFVGVHNDNRAGGVIGHKFQVHVFGLFNYLVLRNQCWVNFLQLIH